MSSWSPAIRARRFPSTQPNSIQLHTHSRRNDHLGMRFVCSNLLRKTCFLFYVPECSPPTRCCSIIEADYEERRRKTMNYKTRTTETFHFRVRYIYSFIISLVRKRVHRRKGKSYTNNKNLFYILNVNVRKYFCFLRVGWVREKKHPVYYKMWWFIIV